MTPVLKWIYVNVMREYAPQQQKPALASTNLNNETHRRVERFRLLHFLPRIFNMLRQVRALSQRRQSGRGRRRGSP